ncbi:hypothetical protein [Calidifontibacillus erzurumensis]|uniref:hypothetical protein n=1 Tax=Calidifontibacillus erzurumensis TaxID=2741433 RepID=UPI0035B52E82
MGREISQGNYISNKAFLFSKKEVRVSILYLDLPLHIEGFVTNYNDQNYIVVNKKNKDKHQERHICLNALSHFLNNDCTISDAKFFLKGELKKEMTAQNF